MRFFYILGFVLCASQCVYGLSDVERKFQRHVAHFGKSYSSEEYLKRLQIFSENAQRAQQWSNEKVTYSVEGNKFADLHPSEFKATILMSQHQTQRMPRIPLHKYLQPSNIAGLPDSFDWRSKNAVNPVRDQGSLGTCWAFSTVENIEGQRAIHHQILEPLSPEQLVECDATISAANREADCGMFGGWPSLAYEYIIKAGGIRTEKDFPYCVGTASCWPCMAQSYSVDLCGDHSDLYCKVNGTKGQRAYNGLCFNDDKIAVKLSDWKAVSRNETEIAAQLVSVGPLSILLNADSLQSYSSGIYSPSILDSCDPTDLDHAVLLVGYGTENGVPYWIVKNSWGDQWGEKGYFRIVRGQGACGLNLAVTTSVIV